MQSPVESLCWQLSSTLKHWKLLKGHVGSCTNAEPSAPDSLPGSLHDLSTETFLLHLYSAFSYKIINPLLTHSMRGLFGQFLFLSRWEPIAAEAAEQNGSQAAKGMLRTAWVSGASALCWEGGREKASKVGRIQKEIGRIHQGFCGDLGLWCFIFTFSQLPTAIMVSCAPPAAK